MTTIITFKADLVNCENFEKISKFRQQALKACERLEFDPYGQEIIGYDERGFGKVAELIQFTQNGKFRFHFEG